MYKRQNPNISVSIPTVWLGGHNGGNANITGTAYNDILYGWSNTNRHETLNGGNGTDMVSYSDDARAVNVNLTAGKVTVGSNSDVDTLTSIENILGSQGNDTIVGTSGANLLNGFSGADSIDAGAGNDIIIGGEGSDTLLGGSGSDALYYGATDAVIDGGADTLTSQSFYTIVGTQSDDTLTGTRSNDQTVSYTHLTLPTKA